MQDTVSFTFTGKFMPNTDTGTIEEEDLLIRIGDHGTVSEAARKLLEAREGEGTVKILDVHRVSRHEAGIWKFHVVYEHTPIEAP